MFYTIIPLLVTSSVIIIDYNTADKGDLHIKIYT